MLASFKRAASISRDVAKVTRDACPRLIEGLTDDLQRLRSVGRTFYELLALIAHAACWCDAHKRSTTSTIWVRWQA